MSDQLTQILVRERGSSLGYEDAIMIWRRAGVSIANIVRYGDEAFVHAVEFQLTHVTQQIITSPAASFGPNERK